MTAPAPASSPGASAWRGKRVLVTGHTGFKGSWLALWLTAAGADVAGYSLEPEPRSLFVQARLAELVGGEFADVRNADALAAAVRRHRAEIVFHLAAQPLVIRSFEAPAHTFDVNVVGTANLLDAVRRAGSVRSVVIVTSDKCYEPAAGPWGFRETDRLGGHDPYSASKACAELVSAAYRSSFFVPLGLPLVTARAGNVIGGGDWSANRLVPDAMRALESGAEMVVRFPAAVRPWQHVLEPLRGYLMLAEAAAAGTAPDSVNFGPGSDGERPVQWVLERLRAHSGGRLSWRVEAAPRAENDVLRLDVSRAAAALGWRPRLNIDEALDMTYDWYTGEGDARARTLADIARYDALT